MSKRPAKLGVLFIFVILCVNIYCDKPSGNDLNEKIIRVENEIPRFSGSDPFAVMISSFNNMLNPENTRQQPQASLDSLMTEYKIPGVGMAVIDNYEVDWVKGYGNIHAERNIKVTPDTYFEAGSTTKILTAALVMKLVEQGKLVFEVDPILGLCHRSSSIQ